MSRERTTFTNGLDMLMDRETARAALRLRVGGLREMRGERVHQQGENNNNNTVMSSSSPG
jgi:hypothetical protein